MKVLFDESVPHAVRTLILGDETFTVAYLGWKGLKNGQLMSTAETEGFQDFVTGDKNIPYHQNLTQYPLAIVMLPTVDWNVLQHCIPEIQKAVDEVAPGTIYFVERNTLNS